MISYQSNIHVEDAPAHLAGLNSNIVFNNFVNLGTLLIPVSIIAVINHFYILLQIGPRLGLQDIVSAPPTVSPSHSI